MGHERAACRAVLGRRGQQLALGVPALHINGGGAATSEEAEQESLSATRLHSREIHETPILRCKPSPSTSASRQPSARHRRGTAASGARPQERYQVSGFVEPAG